MHVIYISVFDYSIKQHSLFLNILIFLKTFFLHNFQLKKKIIFLKFFLNKNIHFLIHNRIQNVRLLLRYLNYF